MKHEEWVIRCTGCLTTNVISRGSSETMDEHRERAARRLQRHSDHYDLVTVEAPAWRQLDLFGLATVPA